MVPVPIAIIVGMAANAVSSLAERLRGGKGPEKERERQTGARTR